MKSIFWIFALSFLLACFSGRAFASAADDAATADALRSALATKPSPTPSQDSEKSSRAHHIEKFVAHAHPDIVLGVGAATEISIPRAGAVRISNSALVSAEDLGARLRLTGKKSGEVLVQAGVQSWSVCVLSRVNWISYQRLQQNLKKTRGLRVRAYDGYARVEGQLLRSRDWLSLAATDDVNYRFAAVVGDEFLETLRADILKDLAVAQLPVPNLSLSPEAKVLLTADQAPLAPLYERALQRWGVAVEVNPTLVTLAPLVRIKILVAEVDKSFAQTLGVNWKTALSAQLLPTWIGVKQASSVTVALDALESSGQSHILASPNLLCRSGKQAEFLAGGEFPIKITNFAAQDVTWKQYGVLLRVSPVADSAGHMSIAIRTEVSDIDEKHTVEGIPGMITNRIESHFDLAHSQTIALSGLIRKKDSTSRDGLPFLSRLPVLGALFSSRAFNNDETELMIFVTPEVVHPEEGSSI